MPKPWCERCHNTGEVDCHCGCDLCVCENNGSEPCPACGGDCCDDDGEGEYLDDEQEGAGDVASFNLSAATAVAVDTARLLIAYLRSAQDGSKAAEMLSNPYIQALENSMKAVDAARAKMGV